MNFRKYLLLSMIIHLTLFSVLFLVKGADLDIDIKKGITSLSLSETTRAIKKYTSLNNKNPRYREIKILISPTGSSIVHQYPADIIRKKHRINRDEKLKKIAGALSSLADYLSSNNPPEYPYSARKMGLQGTVTLEIEVLTNGKTGSVLVACSSGHSILDDSAVSAARNWKFFSNNELIIPHPMKVEKKICFIIKQ